MLYCKQILYTKFVCYRLSVADAQGQDFFSFEGPSQFVVNHSATDINFVVRRSNSTTASSVQVSTFDLTAVSSPNAASYTVKVGSSSAPCDS